MLRPCHACMARFSPTPALSRANSMTVVMRLETSLEPKDGAGNDKHEPVSSDLAIFSRLEKSALTAK